MMFCLVRSSRMTDGSSCGRVGLLLSYIILPIYPQSTLLYWTSGIARKSWSCSSLCTGNENAIAMLIIHAQTCNNAK